MPGLTDLTWTSVNIDMYLARVHKKMSRAWRSCAR